MHFSFFSKLTSMFFKWCMLITENVELILKSISNQHSSESQDNDQPDYDSVASDEDTDLETNAAKSNRQKVGLQYLHTHQILFI